jgi:hypothetical protein
MTPELAAGEALVTWARLDGATVHEKLALNAVSSGMRGVVARADFDSGELLLALPPTCCCFTAEEAAAELHAGLNEALRRCQLDDEAALALWLAIAAEAPPGACALSAYARALPPEAPSLPALWPESVRQLLPWWLIDEAQRGADAFAAQLEAMSSTARLLSCAAPARLDWALAHVRARAVRMQLQSGATVKRLLQVADTFNHETGQRGAAVVARVPPGGGICFVAERPVAAGEQVTWTYGELSSEQLLLQYGFVPSDALHVGSRLQLTLPLGAFKDGILRAALRAGGASVSAALAQLLSDCGLAGEQGEADQLLFQVCPRAAPPPLLALCGAMTLEAPDAAAYVSAGAGAHCLEAHAARARALAARTLEQAALTWVGEDEIALPGHAEAAAAANALRASARTLLRAAAAAAEAPHPPPVPVLHPSVFAAEIND